MNKAKANAVSIALAAFLTLTYLLCIIFDFLFPQFTMWQAWYRFLPGFEWLTFTGFLIGLAEVIFYGFYIGWLFTWIYDFVNSKLNSSIW